jgi:hypothetical protein
VDGAAVVGIGIVVVPGEELVDGGTMHETSKRAMRVAAPRLTRGGTLSSVGVF